MKFFLFAFLLPVQLFAQAFTKTEISRWEKQAKQVTVIRDNYGVPHIYGKTDADAVFGLLYAQCEDDFSRVEANYIEKLGRLAEIKGEAAIYNDLLNRIIISQKDSKADYEKAPDWLKKLCNAFADGINYYLYKHPSVHPALLSRFESWYPMMWTDGSIGAIITAGVTTSDLRMFYGTKPTVELEGIKETTSIEPPEEEERLTGSNGFAFAPKITASGNAILYINPHVTFYFRPEVHVVSEEGLNVYGAVTWGQFFIYQGFNEHCGWMHTTSAVDAADIYIEKISRSGNDWMYEYEGKQRKITEEEVTIKYLGATGTQVKTFNTLYTHHGPIMGKQRTGEWISVKADNRIANGLMQCWMRNKATSFTAFKKTLDLKGNISNNTVYADAQGNIAYWHGNRIPVRDTKYDWSKPVDGSIAATEWKGYHNINDIVKSINPANGWLQNCNSTPYTVAGNNSPKKENYPAYMAPDGENFRGINAVRVLSEENKYTIDKVIKAGYDTRLTAFEVLIPALVHRYENSDKNNPGVKELIKAMEILKAWDFRCGENSVATTLAVHFGEKVTRLINQTKVPGNERPDLVDKTTAFAKNLPEDILSIFSMVLKDLEKSYGKWDMPWGEINRFQRISSSINNKFDDNKPSIPDGFVSSAWGMLPSYTSQIFPGTTKRYGVHGNSFICAVEFGKKIKARSLLAGGESGNENSPHFFDQGLMYSKGQFKEVLFYKEDVLQHAEKSYHPGE